MDTGNVNEPVASPHVENIPHVSTSESVPVVTTTPVTSGATTDSKVFKTKQLKVTLDDHNYLLWHQQVYLTIKTHRLLRYIDVSVQSPPKYITKDGVIGINLDFELFEEQDGALATWLLSTISEPVLHHLIGLSTASDIWHTLHRLYSSKTTSRLMSYRRLLHSQKKGDLSMQEFLMKIKSICDNLANCGERISEQEHITAILNGLPAEFDSVITILSASPTSNNLASVSTILLDADVRQGQLLQHVNASAHIVTLFQSSASVIPPQPSPNIPQSIQPFFQSTQNSSMVPGHSNSGAGYNSPATNFNVGNFSADQTVDQTNMSYRGRGRGRFSSNNRSQCQLCERVGHLVDRCYYRFNLSYKNNVTPRPTFNRESSAQANVSVASNGAGGNTSLAQPFSQFYLASPSPTPLVAIPQVHPSVQQVTQFPGQSSTPQYMQHSQQPTDLQVIGSAPASATSNISGSAIFYPGSFTPVSSSPQIAATVQSSPNPQVHLATTGFMEDNAWYPDSGATHHLTNDASNLQNDSIYPSTVPQDYPYKYNSKLLESSNYITRRQAIKLLGNILLDRSNSAVMTKYVSSMDNLRILMNLLRESSKSIQIEAFHVFKLFAAKQNKPPEIVSILVANKSKLLRLFADFKSNKEDEQFEADKALVVKEIAALEL